MEPKRDPWRLNRMMITRLTAATLAAALFVSACGDADDGLAAPVPIRVGQVAGSGALAAGVPESASSAARGDGGVDAGTMGDRAMWWFGGYEYQLGDELNPLPTASTGYRYGPISEVSEATVRRLAEALGITDEPVRTEGGQTYDPAWTVGPTDGSAPSLVVVNDAQASWYYSGAWLMDATTTDVAVSNSSAGSDSSAGSESSEGSDSSEEGPEPEVIREWEPPEPPEGILTAEEAEAEAIRLLVAMGQSIEDFELEVWADEWYASVNAWTRLGGQRLPMTWNFGFGEQGALQWAGGFLAEAEATGPFPLIDIDQALARLSEQASGWGIAPAIDTAAPEPADPPQDDSAPPREPAVLVRVESDLWWAMDVDGSVWLVPAYRFTDTLGREHVVAAVTDEYLMIEPQVGIAEPLPVPDVAPPGEGTPGSEEEAKIMEELFAWATEELIGMELDAAADLAAARDAELRVARRDGVDQMLTMDFRFNRLNIVTQTADGAGAAPETIVEILYPG